MNYILFYILLLVILFKYIIFIVSLIPVCLFLKRKKHKQRQFYTNTDQSTLRAKKSKPLRIFISSLLNGYIRFFIFKEGMIPGCTNLVSS